MRQLVRYGGLGRSYVLVRAQNCTGLGEVLIALPSIHFSYELSFLNSYRITQFSQRYHLSTIFGVNNSPSSWEILKNNSKLALAYIKNIQDTIAFLAHCAGLMPSFCLWRGDVANASNSEMETPAFSRSPS